jgi:uncharacterized protein (DUF433 family)
MPAIKDPVVVRHDRILGGRPVFRGTRVRVELLFENLAEGYSMDEIIENFPTLDRDDLRTALMQACEALKGSRVLERSAKRAAAPSSSDAARSAVIRGPRDE